MCIRDSNYSISVRGFNSSFTSRLLTLTDGRVANIPALRVVNYSTVPQSSKDIESIEVALGPSTALYGANAHSGVINITSKSPAQSEGLILNVSGTNDDRNLLKIDGRWAKKYNDWSMKISGGAFRAREWEFISEEEWKVHRAPLVGHPLRMEDGKDNNPWNNNSEDSLLIFDVNNQGTLVTSHNSKSKDLVKCVSAIRKVGLLDLTGGILFAGPGAAAKIFSVLSKNDINAMMVSSNPSESSITIVVKKEDLHKAENVLEINLLGTTLKKIDTIPNVAIIAVIGSGMRGKVGIASRVFLAAQKANSNVMMIAQGSSELNLAFVVKDNDCKAVVESLHKEFKLNSLK